MLVTFFGSLYSTISAGAVEQYEAYSADLPLFGTNNGSLEIQVWNDGLWEAQGSLTFDKFFREKQKELSLEGNSGDPVRIKLVKNGVGSLHLDAALLGGRPATLLYSESPTDLAKLAAKDFDVLHGLESAIELDFADPGKTAEFSITARIEPPRLSDTPFQLPLSNMMKIMRPDADFWTYELNSRRGTREDSRDFETVGTPWSPSSRNF